MENDENSQIGKLKRQQLESPFSSASPLSRKGKEPKRLFGTIVPNYEIPNSSKVDEFDENQSENSSLTDRPQSANSMLDDSNISKDVSLPMNMFNGTKSANQSMHDPPTESSLKDNTFSKEDSPTQDSINIENDDSSFQPGNDYTNIQEATEQMNNVSISFDNPVDEALEQTAIEKSFCRPSSSSSCHTAMDLSRLTEYDETEQEEEDGDVTLSDSLQRTPISSPITAQSDSSVSLRTAPSAPVEIKKHLEKRYSHVPSPVSERKVVDESLCEFMVTEKQVYYETEIQELMAQIANLQADMEKKNEIISEIEKSRQFEVDALVMQNEAVTKKMKEAMSREKSLQVAYEEVKTRLENAVKQTEEVFGTQNENEVRLNREIEELTEQLSEMKQKEDGMVSNSIQQSLEEENNKLTQELAKKTEELKNQHDKHLEDVKMITEKHGGIVEELNRKIHNLLADHQSSQMQISEMSDNLNKARTYENSQIEEEIEKMRIGYEDAIKELKNKIESLELDLKIEKDISKDFRNACVEEVINAEQHVENDILEVDMENEKMKAEYEAELLKLKNEIDFYRDKFEEYQMLSVNLREELNENHRQNAYKEDAFSKISAERAELEALVKELNESISCVNSENAEIHKKLSEADEKLGSLQAQFDALKMDCADKNGQNERILKESEEYKKRIIDLENKLVDAEKARVEISAEIERIHSENAMQDQDGEAKNDQITQLSESVSEANRIAEELRIQLENSEKSKNEFELRCLELERSTEQGSSELEKLRSELDATREKMEHILSDLETMTKKEEEIQIRNRELEESLNEFNTLKATIEELNNELCSVKVGRENAEAELLKRNEEISRFELSSSEMRQLSEENVRLKEQIVELNNTVSTLSSQINSSNSTLSEENSALKREVSNLTETVSSLNVRIESLTESESKLTTLREENETLNEKIGSLNEEIASFSNQLEAANNKVEEVELLKAESEQMQGQFVELSDSNRALILQIESATQTNTELNSRINELQSLVEKTQQEHEEFGRKNVELEAVVAELRTHAADHQSVIDSLTEKHANELAEARQLLTDGSNAAQEVVEQLKAEKDDLLARNSALEQEKSSLASRMDELAAETDSRIAETEKNHLEEVEDLRKMVKSSAEELEKLGAEKVQLAALIDSINEEKRQMADKMTDEAAVERLKAECEELRLNLDEANKKLSVVEEVMSQKENAIVTLESRIDSITAQFDIRINELVQSKNSIESERNDLISKHAKIEAELDMLKKNKSGVESLVDMNRQQFDILGKQLESLQAQLAMANQRVVEVEENAQHDVTLMKEEVDQRDAQLESLKQQVEELKQKLAESEKALNKANREVERLGGYCDEFDDLEIKYRATISDLEKEIKQLKGIQSPVKKMGLLQMAKMGVQPLSRENTYVEPKKDADAPEFVDASDSFVQPARMEASGQVEQQSEKTMLHADEPTMHPDDIKDTSMTPSKANRSKCQQQ